MSALAWTIERLLNHRLDAPPIGILTWRCKRNIPLRVNLPKSLRKLQKQ